MDIRIKTFDELSNLELYHILQLRQIVFIVEQDCPYLDADDKDLLAYHILIYDNDKLIATTRLLEPGISYSNYSSIGRVVTHPKSRGTGTGRKIMRLSIEMCNKLWTDTSIKISAQCYLINFYSSLGFETIGDEYLEDGIPHVGMVK